MFDINQSCLNVSVSAYKRVDRLHKTYRVNLLKWLTNTKYEHILEKIRNEDDKNTRRELKKNMLPIITPSGIFSKKNDACLLEHSGLIAIDIDLQDNMHITNFDSLKEEISNITNIAYLGLSAGGKGYWGLIPIKHKTHHKFHYSAVIDCFAKIDIILDPHTIALSSCRYYSVDRNAYFNHRAIPFEKIYQNYYYPKIKKEPNSTYSSLRNHSSPIVSAHQTLAVEIIIDKITKHKKDITNGYTNWFALCCSLANTFGENGRKYFHGISMFNSRYNNDEADGLYDRCLVKDYTYSIGTFFHIAKKYGIDSKVEKNEENS
jgi:hypothetical protein